MLAGLAFCEMLSQCPRSAFQGVTREGQQQFATQTLRVHLLGIEVFNKLKTTPTPNKNDSYGIKGGVRMPNFWGPYAVFSVEIP